MLVLDKKHLDSLIHDASCNVRKRTHFNIHKDYDEPVQRLCIALTEGTYIRPHSHSEVGGWEMIIALLGKVVMLIFDDEGYVINRLEMSPGADNFCVELETGTFHTIFPVDSEAVVLEVKEGPFTPKKESDFAKWAPDESSSQAVDFIEWAREAAIGENYNLV